MPWFNFKINNHWLLKKCQKTFRQQPLPFCNLKHLTAVCRVIRSSNNWYQAISDINCIISWPMPYGDSSIFVNYTWFFFFFHQKKKKRGIKFWEVLLDGICLCHFRLRIFPNLTRRTLCNFFLQTFFTVLFFL